MRRKTLLTAAVLLVGAIAFACSTSKPSALETFLRNLTAAECDNQQATLANLPMLGITPAQAATVLAGACAGEFGTAPAPTPAAGNQPAIPGASEAPVK
jgi:hypothetical protein